jgi:hypothetical protein
VELTPVVRKVLLAVLTGAVAFTVTNLSDQPAFPALVLSLLVGGIVLLVQFLHDLERRQSALEEAVGALRALPEQTGQLLRTEARAIGDAVRLHQRLAGTEDGLDLAGRLADRLAGGDGLAMRVARSEITAAAGFLDVVRRGGEAVAEGEERDWLIELTRLGTRSLDAISRATEGASGTPRSATSTWSSRATPSGAASRSGACSWCRTNAWPGTRTCSPSTGGTGRRASRYGS